MDPSRVFEFVVGCVMLAAGIAALVFRKRVHSFWRGIFPIQPSGGFLYVWQYIVGPLFLILLGGLLVVGSVAGR